MHACMHACTRRATPQATKPAQLTYKEMCGWKHEEFEAFMSSSVYAWPFNDAINDLLADPRFQNGTLPDDRAKHMCTQLFVKAMMARRTLRATIQSMEGDFPLEQRLHTMQRTGMAAEDNLRAAIAEVSTNADIGCLMRGKYAEMQENRLKVQAMLDINEKSFTLYMHMHAYMSALDAMRSLLMYFLPTDST